MKLDWAVTAVDPTTNTIKFNINYVQFQHEMCEVPYKLDVKFYPTKEEIEWAKEERAKMPQRKLICWALNGSSIHKVWPYVDSIIARTMLELEDIGIVTLGDERAQMLEGGWQEEKRVHLRCGAWTLRQSLTFIKLYADLLIGPETGLMNAMCCEDMKKIIFLSHSSVNNLTRDWNNTASLQPDQPCPKCMHRLHMWDDGFMHIDYDEETGVAKCQAGIEPDKVWNIIAKHFKTLVLR